MCKTPSEKQVNVTIAFAQSYTYLASYATEVYLNKTTLSSVFPKYMLVTLSANYYDDYLKEYFFELGSIYMRLAGVHGFTL